MGSLTDQRDPTVGIVLVDGLKDMVRLKSCEVVFKLGRRFLVKVKDILLVRKTSSGQTSIKRKEKNKSHVPCSNLKPNILLPLWFYDV